MNYTASTELSIFILAKSKEYSVSKENIFPYPKDAMVCLCKDSNNGEPHREGENNR
jgi:hypothetical protein